MRGLYIHIPFCRSKCIYCDFASFAGKDELADKYVDALCAQMRQYDGMAFDTVYIGGGTPTVLSENNLHKIFDAVQSNFSVAHDSEITVEANPATVTEEKALLLKNAGVNRVSLGAQSFNDNELKMIGRIHTAQDTAKTTELLRSSGFDNISLDLMYALPGQSMADLEKSIDKMIEINPEHISCYGLKVESGTRLAQMIKDGELSETDDDVFADMYERIRQKLAAAGYEHYEISNFSKVGFNSKHNCKYWRCEEYLGIGLGASSYLNGKRFAFCRSFDEYFDGYKKDEEYSLSKNDMMSEFVILGLRMLKSGADEQEFEKRFGLKMNSVFEEQIQKNENKGLIRKVNGKLLLTECAYCICNSVMCDFLL